MNKIYKIIWSKARNCYIVVSEIAKRNGKCSSSLNKKIIASFLAAGTVLSMSASAWADPVESDKFKATGDTEATVSTTKSVAAGNAANAEGTYSVAVGNAANSAGVASVAIGTDSVATNNSAIAIGNKAEATGASGLESSLAIGAAAKATADSSMAIGHAAKASASSSYAFGFGAQVTAEQAIAFGTSANVSEIHGIAIGQKAGSTGEAAIAIGHGTKASGHNAIAIGESSKAGEESIKIGSGSLRGDTDGFGSISIGNSSTAMGQWYSTATGYQSLALNDSSSTYGAVSSAAKNSVAIGAYSHAGTEDEDLGGFKLAKEIEGITNATAVGYNTNASGKYSSAIGSGAQATNEYATGTGVSSKATGWGSSALGGYSSASNTYATATGMSSAASGYGATALGAQSQATANYASATGNKAIAEGEQSTAVGFTSKASGKYSTALGAYTNYSGNDSEGTTAVGYNSAVTVKNGVALGRGSVADTEAGVDTETSGYDPATGEASTKTDKVWQSKLGAVSVGNSTSTRQITNVAAGTELTDAVNVAQLKQVVTAVDNSKTHYYSVKSTETGKGSNYDNDGATGLNAIAAGPNAKATGETSIAIGYGATAENTKVGDTLDGNYGQLRNAIAIGTDSHADGERAMAIGQGAYAEGLGALTIGMSEMQTDVDGSELGMGAMGTNAIAIGEQTLANGYNAVSVGGYGQAIGEDTTAIGSSSKAISTYATAVGSLSKASGEYATAFGVNSAAGTYSVALGPGSMAGMEYDENYLAQPVEGVTFATAVGMSSKASGNYSTAVGGGANATGANSTAVGVSSQATGSQSTSAGYYSYATGVQSTAIGAYSQATGDYSTADGYYSRANGSQSVSVGYYSKASTKDDGQYSTAVGTFANYSGNDSEGITAIGYNSAVTVDNGVALGRGSVANTAKEKAGYDPVTRKASTDTSKTWKSTMGAVSVGSSTNTRQITNVAAGTELTDAVNVAQLKQVVTAVDNAKTHYYSVYSTVAGAGSNRDNDGATGLDAIAAGPNAKATGASSIAIGNWAQALGDASIAVGENAVANGAGSYVHGSGARAYSNNATAWGQGTQAGASPEEREEIWDKWSATRAVSLTDGEHKGYGNDATAWGSNTKAYGQRATAFGEQTIAYAPSSTAFGTQNEAWGRDSTAFGRYTKALGEYSTAFGGGNLYDQDGDGEPDYVIAAGDASTAFGYSTKALGGYSTAFGSNTVAEMAGDTAFGTFTKASGGHATAFGQNTNATGNASTAFGAYTKASGTYATAFGASGGITYTYDEDWNLTVDIGNPLEASGYASTAFGLGTEAKGNYSTAFGYDTTADGNAATAFGVRNTANAQAATAFGQSTVANKTAATAFGNLTTASGVFATSFGQYTEASGKGATAFGIGTATEKVTASGEGATAFGSKTTAAGKYATAFGVESKAYGDNSLAALGGTVGAPAEGETASTGKGAVAIGEGAVASQDYVYAVGQSAKATAENTVAIGNGAESSYAGSVALGQGSKALAADAPSTGGYNPLTGKKDYTDGTNTWTATTGPVSVGSKDVTRQIKYVAAGNEDTDAVNVAQLKQAVKVAEGAAENAKTHYYSVNDKVLGVPVHKTNYNNDGATGTDSLAAGVATGTKGMFSAVTGAYSSISGKATTGITTYEGTGASVYGSFNEVGAEGGTYDGVGNSVVGLVNTTNNANGALIFGTGNKIENSYGALDDDQISALRTAYAEYAAAVKLSGADSAAAKTKYNALKAKMDEFGLSAPEDGGDVLAIGGGNTADYAKKSSMIGVLNAITGTKDAVAEYNSAIGYNNTIENGSNNSIIGTNRIISGADGVIVIGSADKETTTSANYAVAIGANTNVTVPGGVALGSGSVASTPAGVVGANPLDVEVDEKNPAWTSTEAAISIGNVQITKDKDGNITGITGTTRQITGVAAGTNPTDAVNVAQLQGTATHYYSVDERAASDAVDTGVSNYDNTGATGVGSLAAGYYANAKGEESTAFGYSSQSTDVSSSSLGSLSKATAQNATAVGHSAKAKGVNSTATGTSAQALGENSTAAGTDSVAAGLNSTAVGLKSEAFGRGTIAIGHESTAGALVKVIKSEEGDGVDEVYTTEVIRGGENNEYIFRTLKEDISSTNSDENTSGGNTEPTVGPASVTPASAGKKLMAVSSLKVGLLGDAIVPLADTKDATEEESGTDSGNSGKVVAFNVLTQKYHEATPDGKGGYKIGDEIEISESSLNMGGIAMGSYAHAEGYRSMSIGRASGAYGEDSTAMGIYSNAMGTGDMAIGHGSSTGVEATVNKGGADEFWTTTIKTDEGTGNPIANGNSGGIAIGSYSHTEGTRALAVGRVASAYGTNSTAIGLRANAYGEGSMAFGHGVVAGDEKDPYAAQVTALHDDPTIPYDLDGKDGIVNPNNVIGAIAMGSYAEATARGSLSVGRYSKAQSAYSTAMGIRATVGTGSNNGMAIGRETTVGANSLDAIAVGDQAKSYGDGSITFGHGSSAGLKATVIAGETTDDNWTTTIDTDNTDKDGNLIVTGTGGIAIGSYSHTEGTRALAVGRAASAYGTNSTALGLRSSAYGEGSMAFGHGVVAGNVNDPYAVQVKALHDDPTIPYDLDGKDGIVNPNNVIGAVAMGSYAEATGRGSLSVGRYSKAQSAYSTAMGIRATVGEDANNAIAIGRETTIAKGSENSIAIGKQSTVTGTDSIAIGTGHIVKGNSSGAIGDPNKINGSNSYILGNNSAIGTINSDENPEETEITVKNAFIIGNNSKIASKDAEGGLIFGSNAEVKVKDGVALGNYSIADRGVSTGGYNPATGLNTYTDGSPTWQSSYAAVSVGKADGSVTRQITGLAAGTNPTDAVNVAQLMAAAVEIKAGDNIIVNKTYGADGHAIYTLSGAPESIVAPGTNVTVDGPEASTSGGTSSGSGSGTGTESTTEGSITQNTYTVNAKDTNYTLSSDGGTSDGKGNTTYTISLDGTVTGSDDPAPASSTVTITDTNTTYTVKAAKGTAGNVVNTYTLTDSDNNPVDVPIVDTDTTYTIEEAKGKEDGVVKNYTVKDSNGDTVGEIQDTDTNTTYTIEEAKGKEDGVVTTYTVKDSDKKTVGTIVDTDTRNTIQAGDDSVNIKYDTNPDGSLTYTITAKAKGSSNVKVIDGKNTTVKEGKDGDFTTYAVDVKTDGKVAKDDTGIVTGDTIYKEVRVEKDGNYIKKDNTAGENITALDEKVKDNSTRIDNINNQIGGLDNRMRKGLAGAAALAALHPMDFNPDDKLQFSAGVGNYRGETAAALGAFYRPDESVMFSIGGTFGNSDNMVNAGITFGLDGTRNRITRSRTAMAREIEDLRSLVTQMAARMDRMEAANGIETTMFPDVPENHWAYEYVEDLQKRGALKGYPDGLFKGDRAMTRYEFAAMLDRLVRSGVRLDSRIAKEFEPELGRIYVERISGEDNDRHKIERVRVNNSDSKYPEGKNRDVYGSKIQPVVSEKAAAQ